MKLRSLIEKERNQKTEIIRLRCSRADKKELTEISKKVYGGNLSGYLLTAGKRFAKNAMSDEEYREALEAHGKALNQLMSIRDDAQRKLAAALQTIKKMVALSEDEKINSLGTKTIERLNGGAYVGESQAGN